MPTSIENSGASGGITRRSWLAGAAAAWAGDACWADEPVPVQADEDLERTAVEDRAKEAGLRALRIDRTNSYQAIGDAGDGFRSITLRDCEAVAAGYVEHYRAQGFEVTRPSRRLTVVTLADDKSFAAYLGKQEYLMIPSRNPAPNVHGTYNRQSNQLVVYDHRALGPQLAPRAGRENLLALAHEATHQLTFNTGLLQARGDVPACIYEGLAMYGENPKPTGPATPGQVNDMRLQDLAKTQRRRIPWITVSELLSNDRHFRGQAGDHRILLAYSESWLLVYYLMKGAPGPGVLRTYLDAIRRQNDPSRRLDDAKASLGDLDRLDRDLNRFSVRLLKSI